jgi:hypothetical protein
VLIRVVTRDTRHERVVDLCDRGRGGIAGGQRQLRRSAGGGTQVLAPAHGARAFVGQVTLGVSNREQRAELAVEEGVADDERGTRIDLFREIVVLRGRGGDDRQTVVIERAAGSQINGGAQRAFFHFSGRGLADGDGVEELGSKCIEVETAAAVRTAGGVGTAVGGHRFHSVQAHASEFGTQTANRDGAAFAGVTRDRHARNALQRFGKIQVREVGDVFGDDRIDRTDLLALDVQRLTQAFTEASDDDLFDFALFCSLILRRLLRKSRGADGQRRES